MSAAKKLARRGIDEKVLRKLIPLNTLGVESLRELVDKANVEQLPPQRTIFSVGDQDNRTYYLLSGEVEVRLPSGQNVSIKADTPAALHPISDTRPRQATVVTRTHSNLLCIDRNLLEILVSNGKQDGYQVTEIQSEYQSDWMTRFLQSLSAINVPVKNIENLMQTMEEVPVNAGDTVIRQSDRDAQHYYVLKEGRCVVTKQTGSGKTPIRVAEITEGIGFGEEALLANQPRSATVTMLTDGRLVRWRKPDFTRFIAGPALQVVDYAEAERLIASGAVWIDARSEQEFRRNGLPGAVNVPLTALRLKCRELNVYGKYVAYCDDGHRAAAAAFVLRQLGYPVSVLQNGLSAVPASRSVNAALPPQTMPAMELKSQSRSAETGVESERQPSNESLERAQSELAALRARMQSAQEAEATANQRLAQIKEGAEREIEQARTQTTLLQQRLTRLEQDHASKERELVRLRLELEEARSQSQEEAQRANANIAKAKEEARLARQQANDYALNLAATEAAHAATQNDIQQLRSELARLRMELREEQAQLAKAREAQASELNGMKQNLDREAERKRAAEEALKAAEREAARLKAEADTARRQAEELARRARESESQHATMLEEIKRQAAAAEAQRREAEEQARRLKETAEASRRKAEEEARRLAEVEAARLKALEESEKRARIAEEIRRKADEEIARAKAESEAARRAAADARAKPQPRMTDSQATRAADSLPPRAKSPDESQELADIEQELARLQQKLESKKRAAVSRQEARREEIERKIDPNETSELTQNVYDISQKTQKLPAFKPNQGPPTNVGKIRKSGWVSDAILWETTIGMRDDAEAEKMLSDAPAEPQKKSPPAHEASGEIRTAPRSHSASQPPARAMASGEMRAESRRPLFTAHDPAPIGSVRRDDTPKRGSNNMTVIIAVAVAALAGGGIALVASDRFNASQDAAPVVLEKPLESAAPIRKSAEVEAPAPEAPTGTIQRNSAPAAKPATPAPAKAKTASPAPSKSAAAAPESAPADPAHAAAPPATTKAAAPEPAPTVAPVAPAAVAHPDPAKTAAASEAPTASPAPSSAAPPAIEAPAEDAKPAVREFSDKAEVH